MGLPIVLLHMFVCLFDVAALVLLDLSAAFDIVDHTSLIDVLRERFRLQGDVLDWTRSHTGGQCRLNPVVHFSAALRRPAGISTLPEAVHLLQVVISDTHMSRIVEGVVLVFSNERVSEHGYADDTQGLDHCISAQINLVTGNLKWSVTSVNGWCSSRRLQLNEQKTELIWFGTAAQLRQLDHADKVLKLDGAMIEPSGVVRDLGVYFDSELSMRNHVSRVTRSCFYQLHRLRPIRRLLGHAITQQLVAAFVLSCLDYSNALLAKLPPATLVPL